MRLFRRAVTPEERIVLDRLLDDAFAPARARTVPLSAARVRARLAWERQPPVSPGWRAVALLGRLGEVSLGLGVSAMLFAGALGGLATPAEPLPRQAGHVVRITAELDESKLLRLLRLGRKVAVIDDFDPASALAPGAEEGGLVRLIREQGRLIAASPRSSAHADEDVLETLPIVREGSPR